METWDELQRKVERTDRALKVWLVVMAVLIPIDLAVFIGLVVSMMAR
jgi:hypothetical protein